VFIFCIAMEEEQPAPVSAAKKPKTARKKASQKNAPEVHITLDVIEERVRGGTFKAIISGGAAKALGAREISERGVMYTLSSRQLCMYDSVAISIVRSMQKFHCQQPGEEDIGAVEQEVPLKFSQVCASDYGETVVFERAGEKFYVGFPKSRRNLTVCLLEER
jgi:hypothetical protein